MTTNRILLCTDMDRTVISNGPQPNHPDALPCFHILCKLPEVKLVYVTGRHLQLVTEAIGQYKLPMPEYAITDVGTKIFHKSGLKWLEILAWQDEIAKDWRNTSHAQLQESLKGILCLTLQEQSKQSKYKLSYYLPLTENQKNIQVEIQHQLNKRGVSASVIFSIDEQKQVALLDVLPKSANKLCAIQFLQDYLDYGPEETIFAGDSGNDLEVLGSPIRSILVANASSDIKQTAQQIVKKNDCTESLYIADQTSFSLGGNYTAGIIQGLMFFTPEITQKLTLS